MDCESTGCDIITCVRAEIDSYKARLRDGFTGDGSPSINFPTAIRLIYVINVGVVEDNEQHVVFHFMIRVVDLLLGMKHFLEIVANWGHFHSRCLSRTEQINRKFLTTRWRTESRTLRAVGTSVFMIMKV